MAEITPETFKDFDESKFSFAGETKPDASKAEDVIDDAPNGDDPGSEGKPGEEGDNGTNTKDALPDAADTTKKEDEGEEEAQELTPEEIEPLIEQYFEGKVKSFGEINNLLIENERLKQELENKELTFPSDRAKVLYDFAVKADGYELDTARNYLHILSLDLSKIDAKQKQYEAFKLERPDLTPEKARTIFDAKYENLYGEDFSNDPLLQDEHELATRKAEATLKKAQEDFNNAKGNSNEPAEDIELKDAVAKFQTGVEKELSDFGGITMSYEGSDSPLNFDLYPEEEAKFMEIAKNPSLMAQELVEECLDPKTNTIDNQRYLSELYVMRNAQKLIQESFKHGLKLGELAVINGKLKNAHPGKDTTGSSAPPAAKKSFAEAMIEAVGSK